MDVLKVKERIEQYESEGSACVYLYTKSAGKITLLFDWGLYELSFDCDTYDNTLNVYFTDDGGNKELAFNVSCGDIGVISKFNIWPDRTFRTINPENTHAKNLKLISGSYF